MSFNKLRYDGNSYDYAIKQSTGPASYMLGEPRVCNGCFPTTPYVRASRFSGSVCGDKELIDVDSELMGLNIKRTKCPAKDFQASEKNYCELKSIPDCEENQFLGAEDTRISNPVCTLRGTGWNRWDWLPCSEVEHTVQLPPFERLGNTQIMAKDNHRPCLPKIMDDKRVMPEFYGTNEKTQVYTYKFNPGPTFVEHNNLRTCEELKRL